LKALGALWGIDHHWRRTEEAQAALRAFIDQLTTYDGWPLVRTIAALDLIDNDWPRSPEAARIAKQLNARLAAIKLKEPVYEWQPQVYLALVLAETLDRFDASWAQSEDAKKALPMLVEFFIYQDLFYKFPREAYFPEQCRELAILDRIDPAWVLLPVAAS